MTQPKIIPAHLMQDRYWRGTLHVFLENEKLKRAVVPYINLEECVINTAGLKRASRPWSNSEKIMLNLALHLYSDSNKFNLSDLGNLDSHNKQIALEAIKLRFL